MDHSKVTHLRRRALCRRRYFASRALHARRSSAKIRLVRYPSGVGVAAVRDFASRTGERSPPDVPEYEFEVSRRSAARDRVCYISNIRRPVYIVNYAFRFLQNFECDSRLRPLSKKLIRFVRKCPRLSLNFHKFLANRRLLKSEIATMDQSDLPPWKDAAICEKRRDTLLFQRLLSESYPRRSFYGRRLSSSAHGKTTYGPKFTSRRTAIRTRFKKETLTR